MKAFNQQVSNLFGIKKKDVSIALWMQLYLFLIICGLLVIKPTINALFLSVVGADDLSIAFVLTAVFAVVISFTYHKLLERFQLSNLIRTTLLLFGGLFIIVGWVNSTGQISPFLAYSFYLLVGIYALLATSQFWVLANIIFNIKQAKRLFGFIGAGGIIGGIIGGYLTSFLAPVLGNSILIIVAGFMIAICAFIYNKIRGANRTSSKANLKYETKEQVSKTSSIVLITKSKHLTYLALVIGIGVIVAKLVDFQFSFFASEKLSDPASLASFFGFWFSTFNIVSLFIQLVITKRFLESFNIDANLMLLPAGLICSAILLLIVPELWIIIILKGLDGSLKQSIHKSALELLSVPIASDVKNKTKTFIDVVVDSLATGIAGLIIIFVIKGFNLPNYIISIAIVVLSLTWIYFIMKVKDSYLHTFEESIIDREKIKGRRTNYSTIIGNMQIIFQNGSKQDILKMLHKLPEFHHESLTESVINLIHHADDDIKIAAIQNIDYLHEETIESIHDLIYSSNPQVVNSSLSYLLKHESISYQFFENYLDDEHELISNAALLALAKASQKKPELASQYNLDLRIELFAKEIEYDIKSAKKIAVFIEILGYTNSADYHAIIKKFLSSDDHRVKKSAIRAAGHTHSIDFIPYLLEYISFKKYHKVIFKAIDRIKPRKLDLISDLFYDTDDYEEKKYLLKLLQFLNRKIAYKRMFQLSNDSDTSIRKYGYQLLFESRRKGHKLFLKKSLIKTRLKNESALYHKLSRIKATLLVQEQSKNNEDSVIDLSSKNALESITDEVTICLQLQLDIIFYLISYNHNPSKIYIAHSGLKSKEEISRLHALEYLNGVLKRDLKTLLFPIFELESSVIAHDELQLHEHVGLFKKTELYKALLSHSDEPMLQKSLYFLQKAENLTDKEIVSLTPLLNKNFIKSQLLKSDDLDISTAN